MRRSLAHVRGTFGLVPGVMALSLLAGPMLAVNRHMNAMVPDTPSHDIPKLSVTADSPTSKASRVTSASSLVLDSSLSMGTLPNGMRYYIRANSHPANRMQLWLAVNAGSIQEDDDQRGFAHFLEHMAFNGTKTYPGNKLIDVLEGSGMSFGPDLNAYTSFEETVFEVSVPTDDAGILQQGLQIVQEWANGSIVMDSAQVVGERGVVLGEWRGRGWSVPETHKQFRREFGHYVGKDSRYLERIPIGVEQILREAMPAPLERFYHDWYHPERMAIIAVGDFDRVKMEKEIRQRFGTIPRRTNPRSFELPAVPDSSGTIVQIVKVPSSPAVKVFSSYPPLSGTASEIMRDSLILELLFPYVNGQFAKYSREVRRPFGHATIGRLRGPVRPMGIFNGMTVVAHPDSLLSGLATSLSQLERISQQGIPADKLELAKAALLRRLEQDAAAAEVIPSQWFSHQYVQHYLTGQGHLWNPRQSLPLAREVLKTIQPKDVARVAQFWRSQKRLVYVTYPRGFPGHIPTEREVLAVFDSIRGETYDPVVTEVASAPKNQEVRSSVQSLMTMLPAAGTITHSEKIEPIGATVYTLSNGARVVWKASDNHPDELIISGFSLGGHSLLPDSLFYTPGRLVGILMSTAGGVDTMKRDLLDMKIKTAGVRDLNVNIDAFHEEIRLRGSPRELELLFQMMHLQFTAPIVDTLKLDEWRRTGQRELWMAQNDRIAYQWTGHPRLSGPQPVSVPFLDLAQALTVFKDRFGDASDFTFYIVGSASESQIRKFAELYLASLPSTKRSVREKPGDLKVRFNDGVGVNAKEEPGGQYPDIAQVMLVFQGKIPQTGAALAKELERLETLNIILSRRLRLKLREEMAVTYSAASDLMFYYVPQVRYYVGSQIMTSAMDIKRARESMLNELDLLRKNGPTPQELAMAHTIQQRRTVVEHESNSWLVDHLQLAELLDLPYADFVKTSQPRITAEEIKAAAATYIPDDTYFLRTIIPSPDAIKKDKERREKQGKEKEEDYDDNDM